MPKRRFGGEGPVFQEQKRQEEIVKTLKSARETLPRSSVKITTKEGRVYQGYAEIIQGTVEVEPLTRVEKKGSIPLQEIRRVNIVA